MPQPRSLQKQRVARQSSGSIPMWMWLVGLFAVLIIWQGAFRKWWLPGLQTPLYVAKDVALAGALVLYGLQRRFQLREPLRTTALPALWGALAFVVIVQIFNFNFLSLPGGVMGAKAYLMYTPLLILMPHLLDRVERPERFVFWTVVLGILPVLALGFYQYGQPPDAWINQYVGEDADVTTVLSRPRITGTFSYIGGMGTFLTSTLFFAAGILIAGLRHQHRFYLWFGVAFLGFALFVAPMNGSRSVVLGALVPLPLILYSQLRGQGGKSVLVGAVFLTLIGLYVATSSEWAMQGWEIVNHRLETAGDRDTRTQSMLMDPLLKVPVGGLLGYGTGATQHAAGALAGGRISIPGVWYEGEFGRVIIELGTLGGFIYFFLKIWLAWTAYQAMRRTSTAWETLLAITAFGTLFLSAGVGGFVVNHTGGSLYWLCAGIAVWLWARQEERKRQFQFLKKYSSHPTNGGNR